MEDNRSVEMGISSEGVGVGGRGRERRMERKGRFVKHNIRSDVNTTRGDMQTFITFMRS